MDTRRVSEAVSWQLILVLLLAFVTAALVGLALQGEDPPPAPDVIRAPVTTTVPQVTRTPSTPSTPTEPSPTTSATPCPDPRPESTDNPADVRAGLGCEPGAAG